MRSILAVLASLSAAGGLAACGSSSTSSASGSGGTGGGGGAANLSCAFRIPFPGAGSVIVGSSSAAACAVVPTVLQSVAPSGSTPTSVDPSSVTGTPVCTLPLQNSVSLKVFQDGSDPTAAQAFCAGGASATSSSS